MLGFCAFSANPKYKKAIKPKSQHSVSFDVDTKTVSSDLTKSTKQEVNEINSVQNLQVNQTGNKVETETDFLSIQDSVFYSESKDTLAVSTFLDKNGKQFEDTIQTPVSRVNQTVTADNILDTVIPETNIKIKELPLENLVQLALYILNYANVSLDESHLSAIISSTNQNAELGMVVVENQS
jgi:hypothetical protein